MISNNTILGMIVDESGSRSSATSSMPTIEGNIVAQSPSQNDSKSQYAVYAGIYVGFSNGTFRNNIVKDAIYGFRVTSNDRYDYAQVYVDGATRGVTTVTFVSPVIENNTISRCTTGIETSSNKAKISRNYISDCTIGISIKKSSEHGEAGRPKIENNPIINNDEGILASSDFPQIIRNAIANNTNGIRICITSGGQTTLNNIDVEFNNIFSNENFNIYSEIENNIFIQNNWWGTTDEQEIEKTIYDFNDDHTLGTVNFQPFLTQSNLDAPTFPKPKTLPSESPLPSPSPSVPELHFWIVIPTLITPLIAALLRKRTKITNS